MTDKQFKEIWDKLDGLAGLWRLYAELYYNPTKKVKRGKYITWKRYKK